MNTTDQQTDKFEAALQDLRAASSITKEEKSYRFLSQVDRLLGSPEGIQYLYEQIDTIVQSGIFKDTPWESPEGLIPRLVGGTLKVGSPTSDQELLSELRMLALTEGRMKHPVVTPVQAEEFLEEIIVLNLDLIFGSIDESERLELSKRDLKKIKNVFQFIIGHLSNEGVKHGIAEELQLISAQRPIFTGPLRSIIHLVDENIELDPSNEIDRKIDRYRRAVYAPTPSAAENSPQEYTSMIQEWSDDRCLEEATLLGVSMHDTGLVSHHHMLFIKHVIHRKNRDILISALDLRDMGAIEVERHEELIVKLIDQHMGLYYVQGVIGLSNILKRGLFSSSSTIHALSHLLTVRLNPRVQRHLIKSREREIAPEDAHNLLIGGTLNLLGNPLGVGQGMNPTCQSARALSMWSQFSPEKLINLIITAAVENNLRFRFEGDVLESEQLLKGLASKFDSSLDPVSVVLVPHLDKIYNEMMKRASYRGEDPHKWVNPSFYGHWIPNGFASAYNYLTNSVHQYDNYVRTFYAAFHPKYNGDRQIIYPVPTGLFITNAKGEMLGFHAISILRVAPDPQNQMRIYFLNPNNEGRQNWGQGIQPTVFGNGEEPGESSLPFHEFAARAYAFHYHPTGIEERKLKIPAEVVQPTTQLAKESWGKKYIWT